MPRKYMVSRLEGSLPIAKPYRVFSDDTETGDFVELDRFATKEEAERAKRDAEETDLRGRTGTVTEAENVAPSPRQTLPKSEYQQRQEHEREQQRRRMESNAEAVRERADAEAVYNGRLREIKAMDVPEEEKKRLREAARGVLNNTLYRLHPNKRKGPPGFAGIFGVPDSGKGKLRKPKRG